MAFRFSLLITARNNWVQGPCYLNELKFKIYFVIFSSIKENFVNLIIFLFFERILFSF